ncbi:MAG: chitobiase/beta-hexosaminidase C-terminal domain-containing protein [Candidatus Aminicenantes bacterium RBG_16_66_30]
MKHRTSQSALLLISLLVLFFGCGVEKNEPPPTTTVAAPIFNPGAGTYSSALDVTITTTTSGATIRYTTDGSTPTTTSGTVYAAPIHVADAMTLNAVAYRSGWTTSTVTTAAYTIAPLVAAPAFSPVPGTYLAPQDIAITTSTAGASIRYTTDGTTPTDTTGTLYTAPVHAAASLTLKAVAFQTGWTTSYVTSGQYLIGPLVAAPTFSPVPGTYADPQDVTITTSTAGASIRYTTDGSTPTETTGTLYTGPVPIAASLTLKAVAYQAGSRTSAVTSGAYTIGLLVAAPVFSPGPGTYTTEQNIAMTTTTAGATIRYTTDGSTPTETVGTVYTAPVRLTQSVTLKAVAFRTGWTTSSVTSGAYTIGLTVAAPAFGVPPGFFASARDVAITTTTAGASIRYTTDGSTPSATAGTLYTGPVRVAKSLTLKAVAYRTGWTTSSVTTGDYKRVGISAGTYHTITVKADGTVWTWGGNFEGQVGDGTTTSRPAPAQVSGLSGVVVVAVSAGYHHSVALTSDGTLWAWGRNMYGQLGDGTTTPRLTPVQVQGIAGVTAIAGGENSTYALKSDGTVWAWGQNSEGQLGNGTRTDQYAPVQVQGLSGVTAIAAGELHGVALTSGGTIWAWGNNVYGALGDGTTTPQLIPVQVTSLTGIVAIAANGFHTAAVKNDGTLWACGNGLYGELGIGDQPSVFPTPAQALGLTAVAAAGAGSHHTLALIDDGTLWACGYNYYGQLGDGTTTDRSIAVPVQGITSVITVGASYYHTVAIISDGTVWAWGHNYDYQLGDGTTTDRLIPVPIVF